MEIVQDTSVFVAALRSQDGASAEVHDGLRPGAHFATIAENVQSILQIKRRMRWVRPAILLGMIVGEANRHAVAPLIETAAQWFDLPAPVETPPYGHIYRDDGRGLGMFLAERFDWTGDYTDRPAAAIQPGPCPGFRDLVVYSNGHAAFCCLDVEGEHLLGDLAHAAFDEVFLGQHRLNAARAIVERDLDGIPSRCRRCWLLYKVR